MKETTTLDHHQSESRTDEVADKLYRRLFTTFHSRRKPTELEFAPPYHQARNSQWSRFKQHVISGASTFGGFCAMLGWPGVVLGWPLFYYQQAKVLTQTCRGFGYDPSEPTEQRRMLAILAIGHFPGTKVRKRAIAKLLAKELSTTDLASCFLWALPRSAVSIALPALVRPRLLRLATRMAVNSTSRARLTESILQTAQQVYSAEMKV
jgi:hypothetical protein